MTSLSQRLAHQLPDWARRNHPALRYELGAPVKRSAQSRYLRALGLVIGLLVLGVAGYAIATGLGFREAGSNPLEALQNTLYWPTLILQLVLIAAAFSMTIGKVARETRRLNWDNFRATPDGADLTLRARWAAVFYRLRGLLIIVIAVRIVLLIGLLWDLTAFQGRYLDLLISGITPDLGMVAAILLLSLTMTASLLLPVTSVGLNAALGLLISTGVRQGVYTTLVQVVYILLRVGLAVALLWGATRFMGGSLAFSDAGAWLLLFAAAALGDWGLALLSLGFAGELWVIVPFGIFIGVGLLIFALVEAALADQLLNWAVRRAQKAE
ncbi:MAG: hypothetical protein U0452_05835 [Anaerolineae bacterium]